MPDIPTLEFVAPMPGFDSERTFALVQLDEGGVLNSMQSLDSEGLRFLVAPAVALFPEYAPEIDDESAAELGIDPDSDVLLLVVLTPGETLADTTANLLAPVVVNLATLKAKQVILNNPELAVAEPLAAA